MHPAGRPDSKRVDKELQFCSELMPDCSEGYSCRSFEYALHCSGVVYEWFPGIINLRHAGHQQICAGKGH